MKTWLPRNHARELGIERRLVRTGPVHAMMQKRRGRMQFSENPFVITARNSVSRWRRNLQISGRISVFVELRVLKMVANKMAIVRAQFILVFLCVHLQSLAKRGFHFLKCHDGQANEAR